MYKYLQEDNGHTQLKKVKCQRACKFCRKSHTTCEDTRPCQRCIKRDIAQLCLQDEADQIQQQAAQQAQQQMAAATSGQTNSTRSTVPAKRRTLTSSSHDEDGRAVPPPPPGLVNDSNGGADFLSQNGSTQGTNSTSTLRTPSPARQSDMMSTVPLPNLITSPQDTFRPLPSAPTPGAARPWFGGQPYQQMDGVPQHPGGHHSGTNGGTPDDFSWSALVEGMLDTNHPHTPGDFAWLQNGGSGGTPVPMDNHAAAYLGLPPPQQPQQPHQQASQPSKRPGQPTPPPGNVVTSPSSNRGDFRMETPTSPADSVANSVAQSTANGGANSGVAADGTVQPFNYTFSYSRLRTFAGEQGSSEFKARVAAATDGFKPILHSCLSQYTDDQIVQSEIQFLSYVRQWAIFCDTIPAPACVWRRTGEIYAANTRFMRLIDVSPDVIRKGRLTHYQILEPWSFLDYWEDYSSQVLVNLADRTSFDTNVTVAFAKRGEQRTHLLASSMHFDSFGLPMAATVVFSPMFPGAIPNVVRRPSAASPIGGAANPQGNGSANPAPPPQTVPGPAPPPAPEETRRPVEPSIDVQVGGDTRNPIVRPIALSSLAQLWIV